MSKQAKTRTAETLDVPWDGDGMLASAQELCIDSFPLLEFRAQIP